MIERLFDTADLRCTKCGAKRGECSCWERCSCGWSAERGQPCGNSETRFCSTKVKYGFRPRSIGRNQWPILAAMVDGAALWEEAGIWRVAGRSFPSSSCKGLIKRGYLRLVKREEHPAFYGGVCTVYELTEQARKLLEEPRQ